MKTVVDDIFLQRKIDFIHSAYVVHTLYQQQKLGKYCDLKVLVGDKKYFVHRCILAAASAQLDSQINGLDTIQLVGVTYYGFECLLEILYSGKLNEISRLGQNKFQQIVSAADALNAESVMEYCTRERSDLMNVLLQQSNSTTEIAENKQNEVKEELVEENSLALIQPENDIMSNLKQLEYFQKRLSMDREYEKQPEEEDNEEANTLNNENNDFEGLELNNNDTDNLMEISKCEVCDIEFNKMSDLREHMETMHTKKPFSCEICGMGFNFKSNLLNHQEVHDAECVCRICGESFKLLKHLQQHMDDEHEQSFQKNKLWSNKLKKKKMKSLKRMKKLAGNAKILGINVEEINRTNGKYLCPLCDRGFERRWNLKCHILVHRSHVTDHNKQPKNNSRKSPTTNTTIKKRVKELRYKPGGFQCPECNKPFRNLYNLRRHALALHGISGKDINLGAGKINGNNPDEEDVEYSPVVKTKKKVSTSNQSEYNYWCSICGRGFIRNRNLKGHMDLHKTTGEGGYPCGICGRKFMQKESLHGHLWVHGGGKGEVEEKSFE